MTHTQLLKTLAVFVIIVMGVYFFFQERPLVKVWDRGVTINEEAGMGHKEDIKKTVQEFIGEGKTPKERAKRARQINQAIIDAAKGILYMTTEDGAVKIDEKGNILGKVN
jgi:hypothetical protein